MLLHNRDPEEAESLYRQAIAAGISNAHVNLGLLLQNRRPDEAEQAFRAAVAADALLGHAWCGLGVVLARKPGREREAEEALRKAVAADDTRAWVDLGDLLRGQDRAEEALAAYREAVAAGEFGGYRGLARLLDDQGRWEEAEATYRDGIAAGGGWLWNHLGWMLRERERLDEAEAAYRAGVAADVADSRRGLGVLLASIPGREAEAEAVYRDAVAHGETRAWRNLGRLLALEGRFEESEAALDEAIAHGHKAAYGDLVRLELQRGADPERMMRASRAAADAGETEFLIPLAAALATDDENREEVLTLYARAVAAGFDRAWLILVVLLNGGLSGFSGFAEIADVAEELEERYREQAEEGDADAWAELGGLYALQGRAKDAEAAFREAVGAGALEALFGVAMTIGAQPGRKHDAELALRQAAYAGSAEASQALGALLADQPGSETDAEEAYRAAIDGGLDSAWVGLALLLGAPAGPSGRGAGGVRERRLERLGRGERLVARHVQREARGGAGDLQQPPHRALGGDDVQALAGRLERLRGAQDRAERAGVDEVHADQVEHDRLLRASGGHGEDRAHLRGGGEIELAAGDDQVTAVDGVVVEGEHGAHAISGLGPHVAYEPGRLAGEGQDVPARTIERVEQRRGRLAAVDRVAVPDEQVLGQELAQLAGRERAAHRMHARRAGADGVEHAGADRLRRRSGPSAPATRARAPSTRAGRGSAPRTASRGSPRAARATARRAVARSPHRRARGAANSCSDGHDVSERRRPFERLGLVDRVDQPHAALVDERVRGARERARPSPTSGRAGVRLAPLSASRPRPTLPSR